MRLRQAVIKFVPRIVATVRGYYVLNGQRGQVKADFYSISELSKGITAALQLYDELHVKIEYKK
jgi:hypothetical protein